MKEIQYRKFSWRIHTKNLRTKMSNVCQFELTFECDLHCRHCYTDCYNKPSYIKKELKTKEVMYVLDKVYNAGVVWVCFTGGDPLARRDFLDIYSYAKKKGFLITVFTNAYSMTKEIVNYFKKSPPFVIEMTLNAVTKDLYEKISQVKGSFEKVMQGIDLMLKKKIPLKIKTQVTKDNFLELDKIKNFIKGLGLEPHLSVTLFGRLNRNLIPCSLRLTPEEILCLGGRKKNLDNTCNLPLHNAQCLTPNTLFRCAVGSSDGINVDPYGNTFLCNFIRKPAFNLLKVSIEYAQSKLLSLARGRQFITNSKCRNCSLIESCYSCPGRAYIETGDLEAPIQYYCQLTKQMTKF